MTAGAKYAGLSPHYWTFLKKAGRNVGLSCKKQHYASSTPTQIYRTVRKLRPWGRKKCLAADLSHTACPNRQPIQDEGLCWRGAGQGEHEPGQRLQTPYPLAQGLPIKKPAPVGASVPTKTRAAPR